MMDERLIGEVQKHAIIYNRQKSNMINGDKSASKEMAWTKIAMTLGTDGKCERVTFSLHIVYLMRLYPLTGSWFL